MESLISSTTEVAVDLGEDIATLVYKLSRNQAHEGKDSYEVAVSMYCGAQGQSEDTRRVTAPEERVCGFFKRLVEGTVLPMSLHELTEDFLAMQG